MRYSQIMIARLLAVLLSFSLVMPTYANAQTALPEVENEDEPPLMVTEIYPNAKGIGSNESGNPPDSVFANEFIEIYNSTDDEINLTGYSLAREGNSNTTVLDGLVIEPHTFLTIYPTFSLLNSGGSILLNYPPSLDGDSISYEYIYPSFSDDDEHSWSFVGELWQLELPTPGNANPEPPAITPPGEDIGIEEDTGQGNEDDLEEVICGADPVLINEIVANPAGSDSDGGEFVELYNGGTETASLDGCTLSTDKLNELALTGVSLAPGSYYAVGLENDLLNSGGTVSFNTSSSEYVVQYPVLADNISWSLIDGTWQESTIMTPGKENMPTPVEQELSTSSGNELDPCPEGKFRNPDTNRCKNITAVASSLLPCAAGSVRNPETNRCRKVTAVLGSSTLKPCKEGQERNPATNRCRNIVSAAETSAKPCPEGQERNPETNRCRKAVVANAAAPDFPTAEPAGLHSGVMIFMTMLSVSYGIYEYRLDFQNFLAKIRNSRQKGLIS